MPPSRIAQPLWRAGSTGRCLALRPRKSAMPTTGAMRHQHTTPSSRSGAAAAAAPSRPVPTATAAFQRRLMGQGSQLAGSRRGYADDSTTTTSGQPPSAAADEIGDSVLHAAQEVTVTDLPKAKLPTPEESETAAAAESPSQPKQPAEHDIQNQEALRHLELLAQGVAPFSVEEAGHKFGLTLGTSRPTLSPTFGSSPTADQDLGDQKFPRVNRLQKRYDDGLMFLTRLLMWDGKLAKAERDMAMVLNHLRTSPPPKISPARPLLPGHPPSAILPLDPVTYLVLVIDSLAPIIRIQNLAKMGGGGRALPIPVPLTSRQRRRIAFSWILDSVAKKPSKGSGRTTLATRVAEEIISVAEGRSSLWEKRDLLHRQGTSSRMNMVLLKGALAAQKNKSF